jgi:hypothetical protein
MSIENRQASIVGSSFHPGSSAWLPRLKAGQQLRLAREPTNKYDPNAISVHVFQQCLGYVPRGLAAELAPIMDAGGVVSAVKSRDPKFGQSGVMDMAWEKPDAEGADQGTDQ